MSYQNNYLFFFFSSRRRHTRCLSDWSSDVCSSDLPTDVAARRPSEYRLFVRAVPDTLHGVLGCVDRRSDPPVRSHTPSKSCHPLQGQLAASERKSYPAADQHSRGEAER